MFNILILILLSNHFCLTKSLTSDDDYADLIGDEISKSANDETVIESRRNTNTKSQANSLSSTEIKKAIKDSIETLKKYAQWKGKWELVKSSKEVISEAKLLLSKDTYEPLILEYNESEYLKCDNLTADALSVIRQSFQSNNNFEDIAAEISREMNLKYGTFWHCVIGSQSKQYGHQLWPESHLVVRVADISINLFFSSQRSVFDFINDARNVKTVSKAKVIQKFMPEIMKKDAINTAIEVIAKNNDFIDISRVLSKRFSAKYGENWQSIVGPKNHQFSYNVRYDLMIQFFVSDIEILLYNGTQMSSLDFLSDARKHISSPIIFRTEMDLLMKRDVIKTATEALIKYDSQTQIADYITNSFNSKYGRLWFAILSVAAFDLGLDKSSLENSIKSPESIVFIIGKIRFFVYKLFQTTNDESIIQQSRRSAPRIYSNQMPSSMKSEALMTAIEAIHTSDHLLSIASKIQQHFESKYSNQWQCLVNLRSSDVSANLRYQAKSFLHFGIGEIVIRLFSTSSNSVQTSPETTSSSVKTSQVIQKARQIRPKIIASNDLEDFDQIALNIASNVISKYSNLSEMSFHIRNNFSENFEISSLFIHGFNWLPNLYWNCLVGVRDQFAIDRFLIRQQRYLIIDADLLRIIVFQSGGFQCDEMLSNSPNDKTIGRNHWFTGIVHKKMYSDAQKISLQTIKVLKMTCHLLAETIAEKMTEKYSDFKFTVSVGVTNSFQFSCDNLMKFYIGYLNFRICVQN